MEIPWLKNIKLKREDLETSEKVKKILEESGNDYIYSSKIETLFKGITVEDIKYKDFF